HARLAVRRGRVHACLGALAALRLRTVGRRCRTRHGARGARRHPDRAVDLHADRYADAAGDGPAEGDRDMHVHYPYGFDTSGRTPTTDDDDHLRDVSAQVLFARRGERVMRPDFGSGLLALTFEANSVALAATTQALVQGALQHWLGHLIAV